MATAARGWQGFRVFLETIKFEHSIFALPFALTGMVWASVATGGTGWPGAWVFAWIVVAMVSCRTAAMAYNRIVDRDVDALNPRTKVRAIPAGLLSLRSANLYFLSACALFFLASAMLNTFTLVLSPIALGVTLFYSVTKRFTPFCHLILGLSLGIAPAAAWIATTGTLAWAPVVLTVAVLLWTAGFDVIYSMQDEAFDRENGLRSLPETLGPARALALSRLFHVGAIVAPASATAMVGAGPLAWIGVVAVAALLAYEQSLVRADDLSRVNVAFFTVNGVVSLGFFAFVLADVALGTR